MPTAEQPIPSVWTRPRGKREQPALTRERIVSEALRLLDAEGIDALSMRSLGNRMGAGATSLYRHVANKDELIELVVDEIYGEMEVPDADPANWRAPAERCARSMRSTVLRHPWIVSVLSQAGLAYLGPNYVRQSDRTLAVFEAAGFDLTEADQAVSTVFAYVIGLATSEAAYLTMIARSGQTEQDWMNSLRPAAEQAIEDHPRLQRGNLSQWDKDPQQIRDEKFEYGLARVLDGLETRLGRS